MTIVIGSLIAYCIAQFFQCQPLNQTWEGWANEQPKKWYVYFGHFGSHRPMVLVLKLTK